MLFFKNKLLWKEKGLVILFFFSQKSNFFIACTKMCHEGEKCENKGNKGVTIIVKGEVWIFS